MLAICTLMDFVGSLVKQEMSTLTEHLSSHNVSDGFYFVAQSLVLCIVYCQFYLDLRFMITPLIYSNIFRKISGAVVVVIVL